MASVNFPSNPSEGSTYSQGGLDYKYEGGSWGIVPKDPNTVNKFESGGDSSYNNDYQAAGQYKTTYDIESLTFPSDLYGNTSAYANSWMMIYINARSGSKYNKSYSYVNALKRGVPPSRTSGLSSLGAAATTSAVGAGIGLAASIKNTLSAFLNGNAGAGAGAAAANVLKGASAGAFAGLPFLTSGGITQTQRISKAIALPMPNNLMTGYTADWGEASSALLSAALRTGGNLADMKLKEAFGASEMLDAGAALSLGTQSALGSGAISAASGLAYNPKKEMLFQGVGFRYFTLEYKLYPKTQKEQKTILDIIYTLKFHMHPEYKSEGRYTWIYPDEFDIVFHVGDTNNGAGDAEENSWIHKVATCVLKNINVNYTPDGLWATHGGGFYGAPNAINLTMTFQEITIHTKETIEQGY